MQYIRENTMCASHLNKTWGMQNTSKSKECPHVQRTITIIPLNVRSCCFHNCWSSVYRKVFPQEKTRSAGNSEGQGPWPHTESSRACSWAFTRFLSTFIYNGEGQGGFAFQREVLLITGAYLKLNLLSFLHKNCFCSPQAKHHHCTSPGQRGHVGHPKRCQGQPHSSTKGLPVQPEFLYRPKDMVSSKEPPFWRSLGSSRKKILKNWDPFFLVLTLPTEEGHNQRNGPPCPAIFVNPLMSSWLSHLAGSCRQGTASSFCSPCLHPHIPCPEGKSDLKAG